ncbi:DUF6596 domain-containing protein [Actinomadura sp. NPDC023710]|uniref:RNA polymerase sigma factor n=1 Tax=Actinomadura sp. NPDC023710 TaxID=3158219 RepID=UPI00341155E9
MVREHAGRLTACLIRTLGDFAAAEDVMQDAVETALRRWPEEGVPDHPDAWLLTTTRRRGIDLLRRQANYRDKLARLQWPAPGEPDDRLRLIFICCHPALPVAAQVALTLRTVCGLTTGQIAAAFLVPETTVAQRITRAKRKITDALAGDAEWLAASLAWLMPREPEALGLLALIRLHQARAAARFDGGAHLVPLRDQDRGAWDREAVADAAALVARAAALKRPGPYQLQAAIVACHAEAPTWDDTDWTQILVLYDLLLRRTDTPIVRRRRPLRPGSGRRAGRSRAARRGPRRPPPVPRRPRRTAARPGPPP